MPITQKYMQFNHAGTSKTVECRLPNFGYTTTILMPIDWQKINGSNGGCKWVGYDNGEGLQQYDKRYCDVVVDMPKSEAAALQEFFTGANSGNRFCDTITMGLNTGSGFFPFGADKGDAGNFTVAVEIKGIKGIGEAPYLWDSFTMRIHNAGNYPAYTPVSGRVEGGFVFGAVTGLRPPQIQPTPSIVIAQRSTISGSESTTNFIDNGVLNDSYESEFILSQDTGNTASIISAIVNTIRDNSFSITEQVNHGILGSWHDVYGLGVGTCNFKLINPAIEITHDNYQEFTTRIQVALAQ
jgi:hypothetical protein